ncbi:MAG: sulfatase-like hydrolase/transferase [Bryobacterales bacterium]|nr:sulfatase-like hydrolase/transferase [Bryobacterales bacterium]
MGREAVSGITRRKLGQVLGSSALAAGISGGAVSCAAPETRPNILWLTAEDIGPELGCYGDAYADTPNLDKLAARSLRYTHAWSNAPVCAPARTTIISGCYPTSLGGENMRSVVPLSPSLKMYPALLREAGYYVSNNSKKDYNLEEPVEVWNDSSKRAHWRRRRAGQPFFSVFNFTITHESQIRTRPHTAVHDPRQAPLPAYHPDTPEVQEDWAQYYDNITTMDEQVAELLAQLEEDRLSNDTIIFFFGDHGSGMPRSKRWPYNSGLHVAMLLHIPEKYRHLAPPEYKSGGASDRLISFVDLAPTLMSLAGVTPPSWMQGSAFAGANTAKERPYQFGFRGRMDERYDLVRACSDGRYVYLRQFMPHKIYGQHIAYMFETPTTRIWKKLYDEGRLKPPMTQFWETKPFEELYDLETDRWEVKNLAQSPEHQEKLKELRTATIDWMKEVRDVGILPEDELHRRSEGSTPYDMARNEAGYPMERVLEAALSASEGYGTGTQPPVRSALLKDPDSAVRYWAILGILMRGKPAVTEHSAALRAALKDASPSVRIAAAEALGRYGEGSDVTDALDTLIGLAAVDTNGLYLSLAALGALDAMGDRAKPVLDRIEALTTKREGMDARLANYVRRFKDYLVANLKNG